MTLLVGFWSHALASAAFAGLILWRLGLSRPIDGHRILVVACILTACWAWLGAVAPEEPVTAFAETARNLGWVILLHTMSATGGERQRGVRLVYGAIAAVFGLQLVTDTLLLLVPAARLFEAAAILRITAAAGSLVLVHNFYGQAALQSRSAIAPISLSLAWLWTYELNLYTMAYLNLDLARSLSDWRGIAVACMVPALALAMNRSSAVRVRLSRAATFQSLSLIAILTYFALMALLTTAFRGVDWDWSRAIVGGLVVVMILGGMILVPSRRARAWAKVIIAKHLFEHRYDYRSEWLRFAETLNRPGPDAPELGERVTKAFCDILDSPGGLLVAVDQAGKDCSVSDWNWPSHSASLGDVAPSRLLWDQLAASSLIVEFDALRAGTGHPACRQLDLPEPLVKDETAWIAVPLVHEDRSVGLLVIAAPEHRRALDWEDFDLLRTAARQAASALAESNSREALANARRFEEFNRRFAFILHDIKNLVSQLTLLARNAERHSENPDFRNDMVATLHSSAGKMSELLARLAPGTATRPPRLAPCALREPILATIAARRGTHDVRLLGDAAQLAMIDADAFSQALGQILQNAVEASAPDSLITVKVTHSGDQLCVIVADHGCGMDSDFIRNRLFQPFSSSKSEGFGLGAFEARSLICAMGGRLTVRSSPGQGSEFRIYVAAATGAGEQELKSA